MAGLVAARVLSDHADEVIVTERDESEATDERRPGRGGCRRHQPVRRLLEPRGVVAAGISR